MTKTHKEIKALGEVVQVINLFDDNDFELNQHICKKDKAFVITRNNGVLWVGKNQFEAVEMYRNIIKLYA